MQAMEKFCVICRDPRSDNTLLVQAPCGRHWVCTDDVANFFERAAENESLFPPNCCDREFLLEEYERYVPPGISQAYRMKAQGEYAVFAKFRVYCSNQRCLKFLPESLQVIDADTRVTYATCDVEDCRTRTCISCKKPVGQRVQNHTCEESEEDKMFRQTAMEKGYKECFLCGVVVELMEACNHITCECGNNFCYICGKEWPGPHGCPRYGPALYGGTEYNQDGFHRNTGLNLQGLTRLQEQARRRETAEPFEDLNEHGEQGDRRQGNREWEVLRFFSIEARQVINGLERRERDAALAALRVRLLQTQGTTFDDPQDGFVDDNHSNPDADFANEANPGADMHGNADLHADQVWPAEIRRPATPITRPPSPLRLPVIRDRSPPSPDAGESAQEASEGGDERPDWFPPIGGWPEDEEL